MTENNKNTFKYLEDYLNLSIDPQYAVLINGKWGSGKTFLIKSYLEENYKEKYVYVSLYGKSSISQIEDEFFLQLNKWANNKAVKVFSTIFSSMLKSTLKVDLDGGKDKNDEFTVSTDSLKGIDVKSLLTNISEKIIVFDDIERCKIDPENLLGYINKLVEQNGLKVILVANEEELNKKEKTFNEIKEKTIGKTYSIEADFEAAFKSFNESIKKESKEGYQIFNENKQIIYKCFIYSTYNNLRILRYSMIDFLRFYNFLPEFSKTKNEFISNSLNLFFILSFEIKKGNIKEDEILNFIYARKKEKESEFYERLRKKYIQFNSTPFDLNKSFDLKLWEKYFVKGMINIKEVETSIKQNFFFMSKNSPDWVKYRAFWSLDEEEFNLIHEKIYSKFSNTDFNEKEEFLACVQTLITLLEKNIIKVDEIELKEKIEKNITVLIENKILSEDDISSFYRFSSSTLLLKDIIEHTTNHIHRKRIERAKKYAKDIITIFQESDESFEEKVSLISSLSLFHYIDKNDFIKSFLKLDLEKEMKISNILYNLSYQKSIESDEIQWFNSMTINLKDRIDMSVPYRSIQLNKLLIFANRKLGIKS